MTSIFPRLDCFHVSAAEEYEIKVPRVIYRVRRITWSLQSSLCQMLCQMKSIAKECFLRHRFSQSAEYGGKVGSTVMNHVRSWFGSRDESVMSLEKSPESLIYKGIEHAFPILTIAQ